MKLGLHSHLTAALASVVFGTGWVHAAEGAGGDAPLLRADWSVDETAVIADYPHNEQGASAHAVPLVKYPGWTFGVHATQSGGESSGAQSGEVVFGGKQVKLRPWAEGESPGAGWSEERLTHPGVSPEEGEPILIRAQLGALDAGVPSGYGSHWSVGMIVGNAFVKMRFGLASGQLRVVDITGSDPDHHIIGFGSQVGSDHTISPAPAKDGTLYDFEMIIGADDRVGIVFAGTPIGTQTIPGTYGGDISFIRQNDGRAAGFYGPLEVSAEPFGFDAWVAERGVPPDYQRELQEAHAYLAGGDFAAARDGYTGLAAGADVPREVRGIALLTAAHSYFLEEEYSAAAAAFAGIAENEGVLPHHRQEGDERRGEMERFAQGLPARDPVAGRTTVRDFPEPGATFYVEPEGDDDSSGAEGAPFASLARARDAVRELRGEDGLPVGGVTVFVRGGLYRVEDTFELEEEDSGTEAAPILYRAYPGETPRFHGGVELSGFQPVRDEGVLARLPEAARGHVLEVDLTALGVDDFGSLGLRGGPGTDVENAHPWVDLYVDGEPMELARWPNDGFVNTGAVYRGEFATDEAGQPGEFEFPNDRLRRWSDADDAWMFGLWGYLWAGRTEGIAEIDVERRRIVTRDGPSHGFREGMPFYVFNLLEELERPGEWFLERSTGMLFFYPPKDLDGATVELPLLSDPFVRMKNVSNVTLQGLVFEVGRDRGALIEEGSDVLLLGCTFRRLGTNGIIVSGGWRHGVLGCDLYTLGAGGVRMRGGETATLTPGEHFVANTLVHDFTRIDRAYAPAIHLEGVGNHARHNLLHDSPHHGMRIHGFEQTVEFNEVHSVVYESDDQSGIDMWATHPAYRGNVIRYNFWHHISSGRTHAGQAGIRLDDFISSVVIYGNVFYRASGGRFGAIQIHGGKDNIIDNNLFVDCQYGVSFSPWGPELWRQRVNRPNARRDIAALGVTINEPPFSERYPDLARMTEDADRNFLWRNLAVDVGQFTVRDPGRNELLDNHVLDEDPGFSDRGARDFTLPADSPVYRRLGFRPIPFDEIGLYRDEHRASWPVRHDISPHFVPPR